MIKHIVAFKLNDPADAGTVAAKLRGLAGSVESIRFWEVGMNIGSSSTPYDLVIYSEFEGMDDLSRFRNHPRHVEVKNAIAGYIKTSGTIDYESGDVRQT